MNALKLLPLFAVGASLLVAADPPKDVPAKEPTEKEVKAAEERAGVVADLGTAAELVAFGRGQSCEATSPKNARSPEALVLAGGILWRAHAAVGGKTAELDVTPTDETGKAVEVKREKAKTFKEQAGELFDEARAMVADGTDKARVAAVEAMIKREEASDATRGGVGEPSRAALVLPAGATHKFRLAFVGGLPAAIAMQGNGTSKLQIDITHVGGNKLFGLKGVNAAYNWVPVKDKNNVRWVDVTVTNIGKNPTAYIIATN